MKIQYKQLLATFFSGIALIWSVSATAGLKYPNQVRVIKNAAAKYDYAYGTLAATRASNDDKQRIGCMLETSGIAGESQRVECYAEAANGQSLSCSSSSVNMVRIARTLPSFGWLYFRRDNVGECIYLQIRVGSPYLP